MSLLLRFPPYCLIYPSRYKAGARELTPAEAAVLNDSLELRVKLIAQGIWRSACGPGPLPTTIDIAAADAAITARIRGYSFSPAMAAKAEREASELATYNGELDAVKRDPAWEEQPFGLQRAEAVRRIGLARAISRASVEALDE
jgi:hypothetical protein